MNRFQFLIDCQNDLSQSIARLNKKSKLFVMREPAVSRPLYALQTIG